MKNLFKILIPISFIFSFDPISEMVNILIKEKFISEKQKFVNLNEYIGEYDFCEIITKYNSYGKLTEYSCSDYGQMYKYYYDMNQNLIKVELYSDSDIFMTFKYIYGIDFISKQNKIIEGSYHDNKGSVTTLSDFRYSIDGKLMSFTYGHGIHYFFDYDENNNIRKQSSILGVYKYDYDTYNTLTTIRHYLYDVDKEEYKLNNTLRYDKVSD